MKNSIRKLKESEARCVRREYNFMDINNIIVRKPAVSVKNVFFLRIVPRTADYTKYKYN